jgi:hypothetical protein
MLCALSHYITPLDSAVRIFIPDLADSLLVEIAKTKDAGSKQPIFNPAGQIQQ